MLSNVSSKMSWFGIILFEDSLSLHVIGHLQTGLAMTVIPLFVGLSGMACLCKSLIALMNIYLRRSAGLTGHYLAARSACG